MTDFSIQCMRDNANDRKTIMMNTTRANQIFGQDGQSPDRQSCMFLLNKSTERLGVHLDCDFILIMANIKVDALQ